MALSNSTEKNLLRLAAKRNALREREQAAWAELKVAIKSAHNDEGATYEEIGQLVNITKGRVYQVVSNNRGGNPPSRSSGAVKKTKKRRGDRVE